jgi:hypothetical protein
LHSAASPEIIEMFLRTGRKTSKSRSSSDKETALSLSVIFSVGWKWRIGAGTSA